MYNLSAAQRFLFILTTTHKAMKPQTTFCFVSLLRDCGFDADDWGDIPELDGIYQFWYDQRLASGKTDVEANEMANLIAASRVGIILSQVLKQNFAGRYKVEAAKEPSRFGGRTKYTWL